MFRSTTGKNASPVRRAEVERIVEAHGFQRRAKVHRGANHAFRVRRLLEELGTVFAMFGRYLASRPDLLALGDCLELAKLPDRGKPLPPAAVRRLIQNELRLEPPFDNSRFVRLDPVPFETRLICQLHYGELDGGDQVVVKIFHRFPDVAAERELLPLLSHILAPRLLDATSLSMAYGDFGLWLDEKASGRYAAETLETLRHDCRDRQTIYVPHVHRALCTERIVVTERVSGWRLDRYLRDRNEPGVAGRVPGIVPDELARLLCDVWLHQSFEGALIALEVQPQDILIRSPTELAFVDGSFASFPASSRRKLLDYLIAVATDEPSKAFSALLPELHAVSTTVSEADLDRQFRQIVPFRDGGWEDGGQANCVSDTLFAQWRLLARHGYHPYRHVVHLYRGAFHITSIGRQIAPERDSLLEGIKDLRLVQLLSDIGAMMEPSYWGRQLDQLASVLILGPQHMDQALQTSSETRFSDGEPTRRRRRKSKWWTVILAVGGALLVSQLVFDSKTIGSEVTEAVLFLAIGVLVFMALPYRS